MARLKSAAIPSRPENVLRPGSAGPERAEPQREESMSAKVAHFTITASVEQSASWKQAAEMAGHLSIGTWLAEAADTFMEVRPGAGPGAGPPLALSWRRGGRFPVVLEDGQEVEQSGWLSLPFGIFGHTATSASLGGKAYTLVYVPERRMLGTFRFVEKARALASEPAPALVRGLPLPDPGGILERYRRAAP